MCGIVCVGGSRHVMGNLARYLWNHLCGRVACWEIWPGTFGIICVAHAWNEMDGLGAAFIIIFWVTVLKLQAEMLPTFFWLMSLSIQIKHSFSFTVLLVYALLDISLCLPPPFPPHFSTNTIIILILLCVCVYLTVLFTVCRCETNVCFFLPNSCTVNLYILAWTFLCAL